MNRHDIALYRTIYVEDARVRSHRLRSSFARAVDEIIGAALALLWIHRVPPNDKEMREA